MAEGSSVGKKQVPIKIPGARKPIFSPRAREQEIVNRGKNALPALSAVDRAIESYPFPPSVAALVTMLLRAAVAQPEKIEVKTRELLAFLENRAQQEP